MARGNKKGKCQESVHRGRAIDSIVSYVLYDVSGAVFAMKRKKLYEKELDKIMNVKMTLDTQAIQLESGAGNISIFKAMKQGNSSLAWIHKKLGIDKVDDTMDDIREEMDRAQEINTAIGQPVDPLLCDDDELLAELNSLEASEMEPSKRDGRLSLPTVPFFNRLPQSSKTDEDDYKRLQAELAM